MNHQNRKHYPIGQKPVHLTYRLYGSIPKSFDEHLKDKRDRAFAVARAKSLKYPSEIGGHFLAKSIFDINARYELALDSFLHENSNGPYHLSKSELAAEVLKSYQFLHDKGQLYVYAVCVMSNHVHAIVKAPEELEEVASGLIMSRHKSHTARKCNELLGLTGLPFWEDDYFDRTVRDGKFITVMWYVLNNPVNAGLVDNWREWPNCWINPDYELLFTR
ncbi:transposase [Neolewinella persica]|uniref:transposase n=1 Tax=Neolewinella persica TaxID=70998 RepID=UPI0012F8EF60|nr:transposase [Neolewinella persica]